MFWGYGGSALNVNGQAAFYEPVVFEEQITSNGPLNAEAISGDTLTMFGATSLTTVTVNGVLTTNGVVNIVAPYLKIGTGDLTASGMAHLFYDKAAGYNGLVIRNMTGAASPADAIVFLAASSALVGSIHTDATTTSYNTTSDARLKHAIEPLTGALDLVRRLNPITHLWRRDDSPGVGFLAHEVQTVAPEAVTGAPDAVNEAGQIVPQGMDYSKLVPYLVSAVKELTQQVETLQAKLAGA